MDRKSQDKVLRAGSTIIRKDDYPQPRIKARYVAGSDYRTYEKYKTKAERDRAFAGLLKGDKVISD
ncbi:hypothetical protein [Muribaculum intestinale]|uniref:hypothetical protein n=1 Tax=Muribaculum intestinale TaxID=1796646 RepID=UPI000F463F56|nr:hypothetical protein [Muribaculum intestinale]ROT12375.1 hypothetical protein EEL48_12425 [Muribaculaceae bacterium Isolate-102 (HZI)]